MPTDAELRQADRRHRKFAVAAVRATAILDEAGYPRGSAVKWREELGAFVLERPGSKGASDDDPSTLIYLGPTPIAALAWARRRRWQANEARRQSAAKTAAAVVGEVGGLVLDLVPGL